MTPERFDSLIAEVERYSREHPHAYRARVAALALLGYGYLGAVALGAIALAIGLIVAAVRMPGLIGYGWKILAALLFLGLTILRSMWVRFPAPTGIRLTRRDAPDLYALIERLRRRLRTPRLRSILLTADINAAVAQRPRLGPFGWHANHLLLGVPLMCALDEAQFLGILAHELGHVSGNHGRLGSWVYRVRASWGRVLEHFERENKRPGFLLEGFIKRYVPYFNAYSFVLSRTHEYHADACAVEVAGTTAFGESLILVEVLGGMAERMFWPSVFHLANEAPEPSHNVLPALVAALQTRPVVENSGELMTSVLRRLAGQEDTHPALSDRLRAIGYRSETPEPCLVRAFSQSAGRRYLGEGLPKVLASLDEMWRETIRTSWGERHAFVQRNRKLLAEMAEADSIGGLTGEGRWRYAQLAYEVDGVAAAVPLLRRLLETEPDHAAGNYLLGELLLRGGDLSGGEHLERAMRRDPTCTPQASALLAQFHAGRGEAEDARRFRHQAETAMTAVAAAEEERKGITKRDRFLPHELPNAELSRLRDDLARFPEVKRAYIVRKAVRHFAERPVYAVGIVIRRPWYLVRTLKTQRGIVHRVAKEIVYPGQTYVLALNRYNAAIARRIKKVVGSEVLRK